ncbi:MAG: hypothetical protein ACRDGL_10355 [Candidatus Limnocylindrales bacterium]
MNGSPSSSDRSGPEPQGDPRDAKDRRDTGFIGVAAAAMVALAGLGLLIEGATGGGLLLVTIGLAVVIGASVVAFLSWRVARAS